MLNVILKDGTLLKCVIFETGLPGELPIKDHGRINYLFDQKYREEKSYINFQTEMINGKFHPNNVLSYEILE